METAREQIRALLTATANRIDGELVFPGGANEEYVFDAEEWINAWRDITGSLLRIAARNTTLTEHEVLQQAYEEMDDDG